MYFTIFIFIVSINFFHLNTEVVVINSAKGFIINYNDGSATTTNNTKTTETSVTNSSIDNNSISQNTNNNWTIAEPGMVFVSKKGKYYSRVTNPQNYQYMSQSEADNAGYTRAKRGNENAQP
ncbi:hypothetical protein [Enterococcus sp. ZJ1668]|uniref:hypothetical protein n=1 Tax=Enterococcus sp. ZJ1668 TaxID=2709402 RepID=UPI0013EAF4CD|nr:hypothetical protein [Enterococcus sp. ZJ1668]